MNRDDVIKALKCCSDERDLCAECPVDKRLLDECVCGSFVMGQALQLIGNLEQIIFELENRLKECENGYEGTLFLDRCKLHDAEEKVKELTEENELLRSGGGFKLVDYAVEKIRKAESETARKIFAEINSSLVYIEDQLDEVPDCLVSVKEDIEYLEKKYAEGKSD